MHATAASALALRQHELDRERTRRFPFLLQRKVERMSTSPLAFLRGAAPLFYEILAERKDLASGPSGEGWIVGDMHVENFGAYRPDPITLEVSAEKHKKGVHVAFDINDFDDAVIGPWRWDALRLTTSLLLGGRVMGFAGVYAIDLCRRLLDAYVASAFHGAKPPPEPQPVRALVKVVRERSRKELLDARTVLHGEGRTFARGPRYAPLPREVARAVPRAFARYVATLPEEDRPGDEQVEILDTALRIAGTGSLGALRIGVLVRGKGGPNGAWIFDMKEQREASPAKLCGRLAHAPAERCLAAARALLPQPPRMMSVTKLGSSSMLVKKLSPQDDKLNLRRLRLEDVPPLASHLGALLGAAHARAKKSAGRAWTRDDREDLIARAIELAGIHEAVYLACCRTWSR
jgi:uncharacterized protein (DUF2252 family)